MKKSAFSLLELSVVLLVIGLITVGIMKGVSIVRQSRLMAARDLTVNSKINEISGMVAWYETTMSESFDSNEAIDNAQISKWKDISPESVSEQRNQLTKSANDDVVYRSLGINSLPSVQFTSSGAITLADFFQGQHERFTIFTVFQPTIALNSSYLTILDSYAGASQNYAIGINNSNLRIVDATSYTTPHSLSQTQTGIICASFNGASSKIFINNTSLEAGSFSSSSRLDGLTLGADEGISNAFTGFISEIIIYNRVLNENERKSIMGYLGQKYNIKVVGAN